MKRASYREGVWWIALNDECGVDVAVGRPFERRVMAHWWGAQK